VSSASKSLLSSFSVAMTSFALANSVVFGLEEEEDSKGKPVSVFSSTDGSFPLGEALEVWQSWVA
jgi:hypothetical protein